MRLWLIKVFLVLSANMLFSQTYNSGLIMEVSGLAITERTSSESNTLTFGFGVYYSGKWNSDSLFQVELRPGFIAAEYVFTRFQLGFYVRRFIGNDYYGAVGIVGELPTSGGGHSSDPTTLTGNFGLSLGKKISEEANLIFGVHKTIDNYYGSYYDSSTSRSVRGYQNWILKLGLEINL